MKIHPVKIKKIVPAKKILAPTPFPVVVIDAPLAGLEAIIVPPDLEALSATGQLKLTLRTRNRRIKKLADALLAAHANMVSFTEKQEALYSKLELLNGALSIKNMELNELNDEFQIRNALLKESYDYSEAIIATIHEPMVILNGELRVKSANASFYENFQVDQAETENSLLYELGNHQWNIPALRELLEDIIPKNSTFHDFEVTHFFPEIGQKVMLLNASRIIQKKHNTQLILLAIKDVTQDRANSQELALKDAALSKTNARERKDEKLQLENLVDSRSRELGLANTEMIFQNAEKEKRAAELLIANRELLFQNQEKENRAAELLIANKELLFQNTEKEKRAAELILANKELLFQNTEKEKRATELAIANTELGYQNEEKEKRAAELAIANIELAYQNEEKEKRAAELVIANNELAFQNKEKEKHALKLNLVNSELQAFTYVAGHDLQEPLRKIQAFSNLILKEDDTFSIKCKDYLQRMKSAALRMQTLIEDLLAYSSINIGSRQSEPTNLNVIIQEVVSDLSEKIEEKKAAITVNGTHELSMITFQFRQLMHNLINNALKFSHAERKSHIKININMIDGTCLPFEKSVAGKTYCHISINDNGIGFDQKYNERIFEVFQRLHGQHEYSGTGIGLAIVKKIVDNHQGFISASGELDQGATFNIYIPANAG